MTTSTVHDFRRLFRFLDELCKGEKAPTVNSNGPVHFEGCLPVEEMAERGREHWLHGPLKPVGSKTRAPARSPMRSVQLRHENEEGTAFTGGVPDQAEMERAGSAFSA